MKNKKSSFGDVVVFESNSLEARVISFFTGNNYNHSALITRNGYARNIIKTGLEECKLKELDDRYDAFLILEHYGINDEKRAVLEDWDGIINTNFSKESILKLGLRHILRKGKDNTRVIKSRELNCSTRIALIYEMSDLPILDNVHYTQIEPNDFVESPYFGIIDAWKR